MGEPEHAGNQALNRVQLTIGPRPQQNCSQLESVYKDSLQALLGLSGVGKSSPPRTISGKKLRRERTQGYAFSSCAGYFDQNYDRILQFLHVLGVTPGNNDSISLMVDKVVKSKGIYGLKERIKILVLYNPFNTTRYDEFMALPQEGLVTFLADYLVRHQDDKNIEGLALVLLGRAEKVAEGSCSTHSYHSAIPFYWILRDYGTNDVRAMKTDLTEIQGLWQSINGASAERYQGAKPRVRASEEPAFSTEARIAHYFLGNVRNFDNYALHTA